jgi:general secretion pathway protein L
MTSAARHIAALLRAAIAWWLGELAGLVPRRLRQRLAADTDWLVLLPGEGEIELRLEAAQTSRQLGRLSLRADEEPHGALASILRRAGIERAVRDGRLGVCLRIPAELASRTTIELPLIAESNLDEVLLYELDRHTPFKPEQARFAHRIVKRDGAAKRLQVELAVAPRRVVDDAVALASRLRLDLDRVDVGAAEDARSASENLLPDDAAASRRQGAGIVGYALAAVAAMLAPVAIYLPIVSAQRSAEGLARDFAAVKKSAEAAAALEKEIDALRRDERFIIDRKRNAPSVTKLLAETTHLLKDDTWLTEWQLRGTELQIEGVTASASALVELLEQSHRFHGTTFRSPVIQDGTSGRERFNIAAQIAGEGGS